MIPDGSAFSAALAATDAACEGGHDARATIPGPVETGYVYSPRMAEISTRLPNGSCAKKRGRFGIGSVSAVL